MERLIALIPDFVAPEAPDVIGYHEGPEPDPELLVRCEFFVPHYLGPEPNAHWMTSMPNLKVCQLLTAGFEYARPLVPSGVTLCNAAGVHDASTAELAIGLILASLRGIDEAARAMPEGRWVHERHPSLADCRVLIIGAGGVGGALRSRLAAFEVDVTMVGRRAREGVESIERVASLLPGADIVVLAVPLDASTRHLANAEFLACMKEGALLVNVSRGGVLDQDALLAQGGRIRAALDVTDPEPLPPEHALWQLPGLLITPHLGGNTTAFVPRAIRLLTRQLNACRGGDALLNVV